jgi:hypothetical protein
MTLQERKMKIFNEYYPEHNLTFDQLCTIMDVIDEAYELGLNEGWAYEQDNYMQHNSFDINER